MIAIYNYFIALNFWKRKPIQLHFITLKLRLKFMTCRLAYLLTYCIQFCRNTPLLVLKNKYRLDSNELFLNHHNYSISKHSTEFCIDWVWDSSLFCDVAPLLSSIRVKIVRLPLIEASGYPKLTPSLSFNFMTLFALESWHKSSQFNTPFLCWFSLNWFWGIPFHFSWKHLEKRTVWLVFCKYCICLF